jgi:VWFA-related protein
VKTSNFWSLILVLCFLIPAQAQQPRPTPPPPPPSKSGQNETSASDQDVIRINTNLVQVDAVVTKNGKQVIDLNAVDFEILEDGKPQAITNFSYISNMPAGPANVAATPAKSPAKRTNTPVVPAALKPNDPHRTIAFVVDDLGISFESIDRTKRQLRKFVNEQMAPTDLVAVLRTGGEIGALQQFTTDRRLLLSAIDHLKWNPCSRAGISTFHPSEKICSIEYGVTLRALRYIVKGVGSLPGRKSMVVFSDMMPVDRQEAGFFPNSSLLAPASGVSAAPASVTSTSDAGGFGVSTSYEADLLHIAELAIRNSVVIYTIDTRGLEITLPTAADSFHGGPWSFSRQVGQMISARSNTLFTDRQGAEIIARETGGFAIYNSNGFQLKRVAEDQQGYYLIGYRPTGETFNRKFHHIKVRVKRKGLVARSRTGFYGVTDDEARTTLRAATAVNAALTSPFGANEITVRLTSLFANASDAGSLLRSSFYVNARDLTFTDAPDGSHNAAFVLDSVLFGDNGKVLYERSQTATLQLNQEQYAQILREGVVYGFDVPVKDPGALQFRIAVVDKTSGHLGTAGQVVEVPDLRKDRLALSGIALATDLEAPGQGSSKLVPTSPPDSVPAVRRFSQGANLMFAYAVYRAQLDSTTHLPQLTSQTRIFRDGTLVFTGEIVPLALSGQTDLQRITGGSRILLGSDFPVGEYILQIIVTDNRFKEKPRMSTQWIDFEVAK